MSNIGPSVYSYKQLAAALCIEERTVAKLFSPAANGARVEPLGRGTVPREQVVSVVGEVALAQYDGRPCHLAFRKATVAKALQCSLRTVERWCEEGDLDQIVGVRHVLITRASLMDAYDAGSLAAMDAEADAQYPHPKARGPTKPRAPKRKKSGRRLRRREHSVIYPLGLRIPIRVVSVKVPRSEVLAPNTLSEGLKQVRQVTAKLGRFGRWMYEEVQAGRIRVVVDDGVCTFTAEDWEKIKAKLPPWMLKVPMPSLLSTLDGMKRLG